MTDKYLYQTALCPACEKDYLTTAVGAVYGLHPANYDDVFSFGLCKACAYIVTLDEDHPRRLRLKNRLELFVDNYSKDPFRGKVAGTTLKVLQVHNGDFANAIEIGWPFETPVDQCKVTTLPGGIVIVSEKGVGHE